MTSPAAPAGKSSTGLDQNLAAALTYLGGAITGVLFLVIERDNRYVRFHAMQSTITFLGVLVVNLIFIGTPIIGWLLYAPLLLAILALWLFLMFKAINGEQYKLPYVGELAERQLG
jgi:uncharacterized membrane protein